MMEPAAQPDWNAPTANRYLDDSRQLAAAQRDSDVLVSGSIVLGLAVLGAVLGLIWTAWSPAQPKAFVYAPGKSFTYEESEAWVATDGRFLVLTGALGLVAAVLAWLRVRNRGPLVLLALIGGGLGGAYLTRYVGYLTGGGHYTGKVNTIITHLPVSLHISGLVFVEPAIAALVYGMLVAFATHDDLGRPDPVRDELVSVAPGDHPHHGWGDRDAASALQQGDLPPQ
jgi:hypothetical protein